MKHRELGSCILEKGQPGVGIEQGSRSVALSYSLMESQRARTTVTVDDVLEDCVNAYQEKINANMGILGAERVWIGPQIERTFEISVKLRSRVSI